nr:MAG TPA: hypothetical protein [Caudoviricetes sp.]
MPNTCQVSLLNCTNTVPTGLSVCPPYSYDIA